MRASGFWAILVALTLTVGVLAPSRAGAQVPVGERLLSAALDGADAAWQPEGNAQFDYDPAVRRQGQASARITLPADAELHYPKWHYELPNVAAGDAFLATVWVRTHGLVDGNGAYLVLEFFDAAGTRCGLMQSPAVRRTDTEPWKKLSVQGTAGAEATKLRVGLVLNAHGTAWFDDLELVRTERMTPWPDLGAVERVATVRGDQLVQPHFGGVGFHAFHHVHPVTPTMFDEVVGKRWRELNPSFVRMNHDWGWSEEEIASAARHMAFFQTTGSEIYLTTWSPKEVKTAEERAAYARLIVDQLEYYKRQRGIDNLKTYCMSNELTMNGWGRLADDLPAMRDYHQAIFDELKARKLDIQLLATDAAPVEFWPTLQWAAENMAPITGVYGGHHYVNDRTLDDERFYPWFLGQVQWAVGVARAKHKEFILGEFGAKQDGRVIDGIHQDRCVYFDTPQETLMPIQVAEAALAAINAGSYALGYWTFMDFPDLPRQVNKWGLFKWSGDDHSTRPVYYAYGLLSKYFRGPAAVHRVECDDPRLRIAAVAHEGKQTWSIAVVNRNATAVPLDLRLDLPQGKRAFRKYVYDPSQPPQHPFGDLPDPLATVTLSDGQLRDQLTPNTLTVYTTAYDDRVPEPVRGLKVTHDASGQAMLAWEASDEPDICYYRVYRSAHAPVEPTVANQIASTIATHFTDSTAAGTDYAYRVVAVNQSGNAGR